MNHQYPSNTMISIIEDSESPIDILTGTHGETLIETQPTQLIREPPYSERMTLQNTVEQPHFNLLGEFKKLICQNSTIVCPS